MNMSDNIDKIAPALEETMFEKLNAINVNERTEKKQNLTYLSWSWAWAEFKKACPDASYTIWRDPVTHEPYTHSEDLGYMVYVSVSANNETHEMWLPVMDGANKAQKSKDYTYTTRSGEKTCIAATMFDINTSIMRCLVKCLAMFGLGLYIYAGEDIPEADSIAEAKAVRESEEKKVLLKLKAASLPKFLKYDAEAIQTAFEESGYVSELEDKEAMTAELIKQTNSKDKLKTIGLRTKILQEEIDASLTK